MPPLTASAGATAQENPVSGTDPFDIRFDQLSLEPLRDGPTPAADLPSAAKAQFRVDTRSGRDRRKQADRRVEFRMTPDRRCGKDRRPRKSWEPGHNL